MPDKHEVNYPDVLGFITEQARHAAGPVQVALALRPHVVQAGRPFEVIMLIQNMIDAPVDVAVKLLLPEKDNDGQKGRFLTASERLVVGLEAAEVGYAMLPMSTLPDAAPGDDYSIAMELQVKQVEKGEKVRLGDGGSKLNPRALPAAQQEKLKNLRQLEYSTKKRGLFRGNTLETTLELQPGKVGTPLNFKPGWESIWRLEEQGDTVLLLEKYRELFQQSVLPALDRKKLYPPLLAKTEKLFEAVGYPLTAIEASCVARLLTLILEYADAHTAQSVMVAGIYNIEPLIEGTAYLAEDGAAKRIPHWLDGMLRATAKDERAARMPVKAIPALVYKDLMHDAMMHGLKLVEKQTDEDLGSYDEMEAYAQSMMDNIFEKRSVDFSTAYMPLVMGGVLVYDQVLMPRERLEDGLDEIKFMLDARSEERDGNNDVIFGLAQRVIDQSLRKYGSLDNRL